MPSTLKDPMWTQVRDWANNTLGPDGFQAGFSSVALGVAPSQLHIWRGPLLIICYPQGDSIAPWTLPNGHGVNQVIDGEVSYDKGFKGTTLEQVQTAVLALIKKYGEATTQKQLMDGF